MIVALIALLSIPNENSAVLFRNLEDIITHNQYALHDDVSSATITLPMTSCAVREIIIE